MSDTLYHDDVLAWSEQQTELLARASTGERVNGLDWPNLIEEIDSVGKSQLQSCESLLQQALRHLLKCAGWPHSESVGHWQDEAATFLPQACRAFSPSMRQKIDVPALYRQALYAVRRNRIDHRGAEPLPDACPLSLDDLLTPDPDLDALIGKLLAAADT